MPTGKSHFSLSWDKYRNVMCDGFSTLQQNGEFVDMTIAADGHLVKVHQMIISLASPYLKELIRSAACPHPVIFLNNVSHQILCNILEYIYTGEVAVQADKLTVFIETSKALHIKGLEDLVQTQDTNVSNEVVFEVDPMQNQMARKTLSGNMLQVESSKSQENSPATQPSAPPALRKLMKRDVPLISTARNNRTIVIDPTPMKDDMSSMEDYMDQDEPALEHSAAEVESEQVASYPTPSASLPVYKDQTPKQGDLQFTISNRGALQLILNRYMYNLTSRSRDGRTRRWKCVEYRNNKCPAVAVTDLNFVVSRVAMHTHPFHDKRILSKIEKQAVYSAIKQAEEAGANMDAVIDD